MGDLDGSAGLILNSFELTDKKCSIHPGEKIWKRKSTGEVLKCPLCADADRIEEEREEKREKDLGRIEERVKLFQVHGYADMTWESTKVYDSEQERVRGRLWDMSNGRAPWRNLLLIGDQGTGKSLYAYLIGVDEIRRGGSAVRLKSKLFFNEVEHRRSHQLNVNEYLESIVSRNLVIFDEIGRSVGSKSENDNFFHLLDLAEERRTRVILICNLNFKPMGERIPGNNYAIDYIDEDRVSNKKKWQIIPFTWQSYRRLDGKN